MLCVRPVRRFRLHSLSSGIFWTAKLVHECQSRSSRLPSLDRDSRVVITGRHVEGDIGYAGRAESALPEGRLCGIVGLTQGQFAVSGSHLQPCASVEAVRKFGRALLGISRLGEAFLKIGSVGQRYPQSCAATLQAGIRSRFLRRELDFPANPFLHGSAGPRRAGRTRAPVKDEWPGSHMKQERPFQTYDQGECQHGHAGYPSQVPAMSLFEVQFGHHLTPVVWEVRI